MDGVHAIKLPAVQAVFNFWISSLHASHHGRGTAQGQRTTDAFCVSWMVANAGRSCIVRPSAAATSIAPFTAIAAPIGARDDHLRVGVVGHHHYGRLKFSLMAGSPELFSPFPDMWVLRRFGARCDST